MRFAPALVGLALALCAALAHAAGGCLDRPGARPVVRETLVMLLNPMGAEHQLRVGACMPLYPSASEAFSGNHFELGLTNYTSPVYAMTGPYVELAPASFFSLRLELTGAGIWPLPMAGAGYYPRPGPRATFYEHELPEKDGRSTGGWSARAITGWGAKVSLGKLALVAGDALWLDHGEIGPAPYFLDLRNDLVAARADNVVGNEGAVFLEVPIRRAFLRFGAYDALRAMPLSGYVGHQVGGIAMLELTNVTRAISSLAFWARLGGYTHHAIRAGEAATLLGVAVDWDLGGRSADE